MGRTCIGNPSKCCLHQMESTFSPSTLPGYRPTNVCLSCQRYHWNTKRKPSLNERVVIAGMSRWETKKLEGEIELVVGMRAMVVINIATEANLSNGTRRSIVDIILDERDGNAEKDETGTTYLCYPPSVILFKPNQLSFPTFTGLPNGVIPLFPMELKFTINIQGKSLRVTCCQYGITTGYAFTNYKAQAQTLDQIYIDLAKPPNGQLTPFSTYVALSRGQGRHAIRLLRDFKDKLFTHHPLEDLRKEDKRLEMLNKRTRVGFVWGEYSYQ